MVVGSCNPVAPPIEIWFDPPKAFGKVVVRPPVRGGAGLRPRRRHRRRLRHHPDRGQRGGRRRRADGGAAASATCEPTIVGVDTRFESWVTEVTDRRTYSVGPAASRTAWSRSRRPASSSTCPASASTPCTGTGRRPAPRRPDDAGASATRGRRAFSRVCSTVSCRGDRSQTCRAPEQQGESTMRHSIRDGATAGRRRGRTVAVALVTLVARRHAHRLLVAPSRRRRPPPRAAATGARRHGIPSSAFSDTTGVTVIVGHGRQRVDTGLRPVQGGQRRDRGVGRLRQLDRRDQRPQARRRLL